MKKTNQTGIIEIRNAEHQRCLDDVAAFVAAGGVIQRSRPLKHDPLKDSIKFPDPKHKLHMEDMTQEEKIIYALSTYISCTSKQLVCFTGVNRKKVFSFARILQSKGLIDRRSKLGQETVFYWLMKL